MGQGRATDLLLRLAFQLSPATTNCKSDNSTLGRPSFDAVLSLKVSLSHAVGTCWKSELWDRGGRRGLGPQQPLMLSQLSPVITNDTFL